ncbi:MAG: hypothetical protein G01um101466_670, partial [Parcubacteria group bacterium Gr01-1014_66]
TKVAGAVASPIDKNPDFFQKVIPPPPLTERIPYLLPFALGAVVLILGALLWRLVQNISLQKEKVKDQNDNTKL